MNSYERTIGSNYPGYNRRWMEDFLFWSNYWFREAVELVLLFIRELVQEVRDSMNSLARPSIVPLLDGLDIFLETST